MVQVLLQPSTPFVSKAFPFTLSSSSSSLGGEVLWFNDGLEILSFFFSL
jgi:hypothetical protein